MDKKKVSCHFCKTEDVVATKPSAAAAVRHSMACGEFGMEKNRLLALNSYDAYQSNNFKQPGPLHSVLGKH